MGELILLRHGQSVWNKKNVFTGWVDVPLSLEGMQESIAAGELIAEYDIEVVFTSSLLRSQMTACLAMARGHPQKEVYVRHSIPEPHGGGYEEGTHDPSLVPLIRAWELNERKYGLLQGRKKDEIIAEYGEQQVRLWRRSFQEKPPQGESLADTAARTIPYFEREIRKLVEKGRTVLVCAHGNSLRSLVMHIETMTEEKVLSCEIATGGGLVYRQEKNKLVRYV